MRRLAIASVLVAFAAVACGRGEVPAAEAGELSAGDPGEAPSAATPADPSVAASESVEASPRPRGVSGALPELAPTAPAPLPASEEGLLQAIAEALAARDLARAQAACAPELAADLRRLHDEDPERFWRRGDLLVENVRSGVTIAHRQDDTAPSWRVLVRFGGGEEETMSFTRRDGKLRIDGL